jgi:hypothetical protein
LTGRQSWPSGSSRQPIGVDVRWYRLQRRRRAPKLPLHDALGLSGLSVRNRASPSRNGQRLFDALPALSASLCPRDFILPRRTCERLYVFAHADQRAKFCHSRGQPPDQILPLRQQRILSAPLSRTRGGGGTSRMIQIPAPAATLFCQPGEQLPDRSP